MAALGAGVTAITSASALGYAYRQLTTKGIDSHPSDKTRWTAVYYGGQVATGGAAVVAGLALVVTLGALVGAVVAVVVRVMI